MVEKNSLIRLFGYRPANQRQTWVLPPHRNDGLEVVYIANGTLFWQVEGVQEVVYPDSVFFTLPWQKHGGVEVEQPGWELYFVVIGLNTIKNTPGWQFLPHLAISRAESDRIIHELSTMPFHCAQATANLSFLMPSLIRELETPGLFHEHFVRTTTAAIVIELLRSLCERKNSRNTECPYGGDTETRVAHFISHLTNTFTRQWQLNEMARQCGIARTRFAGIVKKRTGYSPIIFLNRLRINHAKKLLMETNESITHIASECGFNDSHYFAKTFRLFAGIDPRSYRKKERSV
jgi:AraC-like DNA-binding protein